MVKKNRLLEKPLVIPSVLCRALRRRLLCWYAAVQRDLPWRRSTDPYAIWISEVMLQQTQVNTVQPYYQRFMEQFPDIVSLARAPSQTVLKAWQGLGYYSRARNLHRTAEIVAFEMDARLPDDWESLRALPGIGSYTAAAILSIAFQQPYAVVDGNVKRVLARLFMIKMPVNKNGAHRVFQNMADQLLDPVQPGDYNQAMMELGALVCLARQPVCRHCPLKSMCRAFRAAAVDLYPVRAGKKIIPEKHMAVAAIVKDNRLLVVQRPPDGLLGALWEFPGAQVRTAESLKKACRRAVREAVSLDVAVVRHLQTIHHTYTHFKLKMDVFLCLWQNGRVRRRGPKAHRWLFPGRIRQLPLHGAMLKALPIVEKELLAKQAPIG
jgi:A/G-specific adenine glycosylase